MGSVSQTGLGAWCRVVSEAVGQADKSYSESALFLRELGQKHFFYIMEEQTDFTITGNLQRLAGLCRPVQALPVVLLGSSQGPSSRESYGEAHPKKYCKLCHLEEVRKILVCGKRLSRATF